MSKYLHQFIILSLLLISVTGCAGTNMPFHVASEEDRLYYLESTTVEDPDIEAAIKKGEIIRGMTKEQVEATWGEPSYHGSNRWEYKGWENIIIVFRNGRVAQITKNFE